MVQLILGTVQLGLDYGINNKLGKPNSQNAFEILDYAYHHEISLLDTASAYGDSESIIGNYIADTGNEFQIATKLAPLDDSKNVLDFINTQLNSSLKSLSKDHIDYYLIHNFMDILNHNDLIDLLKNLNKICNIGVSLYEPEELEYLLLNHSEDIDFIQIPFNILDSRWIKNDILKRTKSKNMKIFVRSIFLQGLIFLEDEKEMAKIDSSLKEYIEFINTLANKKNVSISHLAMDYVKSFDEIDGILVGCETVNQLKENIYQFNDNISLNKQEKQEIFDLTKNIPKNIIDPRKW